MFDMTRTRKPKFTLNASHEKPGSGLHVCLVCTRPHLFLFHVDFTLLISFRNISVQINLVLLLQNCVNGVVIEIVADVYVFVHCWL
jgi:hypothetical protein